MNDTLKLLGIFGWLNVSIGYMITEGAGAGMVISGAMLLMAFGIGLLTKYLNGVKPQ